MSGTKLEIAVFTKDVFSRKVSHESVFFFHSQDEQVCSYSYSARQDHFDSEERQYTKITATVDVTCTSSNGLSLLPAAIVYCSLLL